MTGGCSLHYRLHYGCPPFPQSTCAFLKIYCLALCLTHTSQAHHILPHQPAEAYTPIQVLWQPSEADSHVSLLGTGVLGTLEPSVATLGATKFDLGKL